MGVKNSHPDLLGQLEEGIARLASSDAWRDHLNFQSRFHRYSYGNVLLIASQHQRATQVAGFKSWQRVNRVVRKGEKAIWILAPMIRKNAGPKVDDDKPTIRGFKYVPVFDISQTVGDDPPTICRTLSGDDYGNSYGRLVSVAWSLGFHFEDHEFGDSTNGDCCPSEARIRVEARNSPAQRVKTLAHELAHALLHDRVDDRPLAELEAESTAYVVCRQIGMDTGDYSFGYVASWAGGGERAITRIRSSCERIQKASSLILHLLQDEQDKVA